MTARLLTGTAEGPLTIVVGSGKGGVGKSLVSVLVAQACAAAGHRTLLFDADHNLANLHVLLGVRPKARLESVLLGETAPEALVQEVAEHLALLPGDSGAETLYGLDGRDRARLHHRLSAIYERFDVVIVDAGAGLEGVVRACSMRAGRLLVVTAPEPAALTDAYALMKIVHLQVPDLPMDVLVNRTLDADEGREAFDKLATACERFLRRGIRYLGAIPEEEALRRAVRDPRSLLERLARSGAHQLVKEAVLDRLDLPVPARSDA